MITHNFQEKPLSIKKHSKLMEKRLISIPNYTTLKGGDNMRQRQNGINKRAGGNNTFANISIFIALVTLIYANTASLRSEMQSMRTELKAEIQSVETQIHSVENKLDTLLFHLLNEANSTEENLLLDSSPLDNKDSE